MAQRHGFEYFFFFFFKDLSTVFSLSLTLDNNYYSRSLFFFTAPDRIWMSDTHANSKFFKVEKNMDYK